MVVLHITPTLFTFVILCLTLLERGHGTPSDDWRGQPEVQQPLDNAAVYFNLPFPSGRGQGFPRLFTQKTSTLLSEALHMLRKVQDNKERRWLEAFIHRLGSLAADLEESNSRNAPNGINTLLPTESHVTLTSPVKANRKFQAKYQVTSAHINDVLPDNDGVLNGQVVTRPGLRKAEDELVQQLRDQKDIRQKPIMDTESRITAYHTRPIETTNPQTITEPTMPLHVSNKVENSINKNEKQRRNLLLKLLNEMNDLKRHGIQQKEEISSLKLDNHQIADFTKPQLVLDQKHNSLEEDNEFEIEEDANNEDETDSAIEGALENYDGKKTRIQFPSVQKVLKASTEGFNHHFIQERQQIQLHPPQPTMSDEMERQLRSGRIVVLSDSLVRTNFQHPSVNQKNSKLLPAKSTSLLNPTTIETVSEINEVGQFGENVNQ